MSGSWVDEQVPCFDPECPGTAEPEQDGDHRYYACDSCGFEFGHQRVRQPDSSCALGVSEDTRARFSQPAGRPEPVMLQLGRRPE